MKSKAESGCGPVPLRGRQSFFLPTVRFAAYFCVTAFFCVAAILRDNKMLAAVGTFLIVIPVILIAYLIIIYLRISVTFGFSDGYVPRGQPVYAVLTVRNDSRLPLVFLDAALDLPASGRDGTVRGRARTRRRAGAGCRGRHIVTAKRTLIFARCGGYGASCGGISVYDPIGLFRIRSRLCFSDTVSVIPAGSGARSGTAQNSVFLQNVTYVPSPDSDREEFFDIRTYLPGDPLNAVHWKLSAKNDDFQVVRYASPKKKSSCVLCDTGDYTDDPCPEQEINACMLDAVYEAAYELCTGKCGGDESVKLVWLGGGGIKYIDSADDIDPAFAALCASDPLPAGTSRAETAEALAGSVSVSVVTAAITPVLVSDCEFFRTRVPGIAGIEIILASPAGGIPVYANIKAPEAPESRHGQEEPADLLRRLDILGIPVISCCPGGNAK